MSDAADGPEPRLSLVIAATHSRAAVSRTLASLEAAMEDPRVEVVVAASGFEIPEGVRGIAAPRNCGAPRLRRLGLDAARGAAVVFTEDSCGLDAQWVEAWRLAFDDSTLIAATGTVVPDMGGRRLDWAVFFCEYAVFLPAEALNTVPNRLAGNNFGVRRSWADRLDPWEIHEGEVAAQILGEGGSLCRISTAIARHVRRYGGLEALLDRFRFGRDYGRRRAAGRRRTALFLSWVVGPVVLLVQVARTTVTAVKHRRYLATFVAAFPLTLVLLSAWSLGEWLGWMEASPQLSRRRRGTAAQLTAPDFDPAVS